MTKGVHFHPERTLWIVLDPESRSELGDFITTHEHHYYDEADGTHIVVPRGFRTDFASFPRLLWIIFKQTGPWATAALFHDWLYRTQRVPQFKADAIFRNIMHAKGVDERLQKVFFVALRLYGKHAYKAAGERLKAMPGGELDLTDDLRLLDLDEPRAA